MSEPTSPTSRSSGDIASAILVWISVAGPSALAISLAGTGALGVNADDGLTAVFAPLYIAAGVVVALIALLTVFVGFRIYRLARLALPWTIVLAGLQVIATATVAPGLLSGGVDPVNVVYFVVGIIMIVSTSSAVAAAVVLLVTRRRSARIAGS